MWVLAVFLSGVLQTELLFNSDFHYRSLWACEDGKAQAGRMVRTGMEVRLECQSVGVWI